VFEVLQSYTSTLPKNLWLAVNEDGVHIMRRRSREPLITYSYRTIVNYSPSLRNLMIVTESLTRGTKFVFNTSQVRPFIVHVFSFSFFHSFCSAHLCWIRLHKSRT